MQHDGGAFSLRVRQLAAISRMLNLDRDEDAGRSGWHDPWKVLVYDAFCRDVISPLLKVGDLRKRGVTLHLLLDSEREQIADVPAVYFVRPTPANTRRIAADCAAALYESFYLNFTPSIPRPLLESLASQTLESDCVAHISRVVDQYLSFASLEDDLFSLQLPRAYPTLISPDSKDSEIEGMLDEVVSGLFSVLVTLGVVPVLRYSRRGPAQSVATGLGQRLHAQLRSHATLFSGAAATALQRPLMLLVDRTDDLGVMLQHGWSYCALCHDLLGMRLNRLTVNETIDGGGVRARSYDLHQSDSFWAEHMGSAFQTVASQVDERLQEYRKAMDEINAGGAAQIEANSLGLATRKLQSTIAQLPELQEKKRLLDMHTIIATELLRHIKERSLDSFYALEESLLEGRSLSKDERSTLVQLLSPTGELAATPEDRVRLLMLLSLHPGGVPATEIDGFEKALAAAGADLRPLHGLRSLLAIDSAAMAPTTGVVPPAPSTFGGLRALADKVAARGVSALAAGLKNMLPSKRETPITRAVSLLMENRAPVGGGGGGGGGASATVEDDAFGYIDPKVGDSDGAGAAAGRGRGPFSSAIVFVVGPGNYLEYMNLRERSRATVTSQGSASGARKVLYGCTELLGASGFAAQLAPLAAPH